MTSNRSVLRALTVCAGVAYATVAAAQAPAAQPAPAQPAAAAKAPAKPAAKKPAGATFQPVVEARALALLRAMSDRLASAKSLSFTAVVGYEYPSKLGPPVVYTTRYDVTLQRPDKLRILMPGDGPASEFYYDGRSMIAYAPVENLAAVADAPPALGDALAAAYKTAGIFFPFTDLLLPDPFAALTDGAILAFVIGPSSVVGGTKTDMVAWANNEVFLQIWIGAEDRLPRRLRAVFRQDPLRLRHEMELSNWQIDPIVAAETFASAKVQSAGRMPFAAPSPPPKGVKPIVKGMGAKAAPAKPAPKGN